MNKNEIRQQIIDQMPEYIKSLNKVIQGQYVEYQLARYIWEESEYVNWEYENGKGETRTVNLGDMNFVEKMNQERATEATIAKAKEAKRDHAQPLLNKLRLTQNKFKASLKTRYPATIVNHLDKIIELFSSYYTVKDVQDYFKKESKLSIGSSALKLFYQDNQALIEQRRLEFQAQKKDMYIATDTGRLQILNNLLMKMNAKFQKDERVVYSREIRAILEQARKEIKGDQLFLTVDGQIDINASIHGQENTAKVLQRLSVNMLIIGLVAAKSGQNPAVLMGQLASSYYKNENGFNGGKLDGRNIQLPGDIIRNMQWDELGEMNRKWQEEKNDISDALIIEDDQKVEVERRKKSLLELIRSRKETAQ